ncbi:HIRAN domain-containing protein [Thiorhodovibrio frisius]|uniref:HIRAN domain-containing protein n=1 Tax=Thiorhodovibrio frisius TaxID=631362 RepID=H8Z0E7_9GAMM|nr:HIRAN domain-containing protein [Thiorhodovibrio frisius]EIC21248.1 hypothetical protein Thi970DRAFT_01439 [Thiorhodovibrio frisius]WPL23824.1 hypothetical protein Thiofri_04030 [Thiorhodovibrio frisius]
MKTLFIAWQDPKTRRWLTVGRLDRDTNGGYCFRYTQGAEMSPRFSYLGRMIDKRRTYYSNALFPLFSNRLLTQKRPEYPAYLSWMGVADGADPLEILARSGGRRGTDKLSVYPMLQPDARGWVTLYFFAHGVRYLSEDEQIAIPRLCHGERLELRPEDDNREDRYALRLASEQAIRVGYCPRYLNKDLHCVLQQTSVDLTVEKANDDAPMQFRLLCKAVFRLPAGCTLHESDEHQLIAEPAMAA